MQPGFYYAEIMLELTGSFAVAVSTTYGVIAEITAQDKQGTCSLRSPDPVKLAQCSRTSYATRYRRVPRGA
jgi:hypothetical protein